MLASGISQNTLEVIALVLIIIALLGPEADSSPLVKVAMLLLCVAEVLPSIVLL